MINVDDNYFEALPHTYRVSNNKAPGLIGQGCERSSTTVWGFTLLLNNH